MNATLRALAAGVLLGAAPLVPRGLAKAPAWLQPLAAQAAPAVSPDAPAVVLLNETVLTIDGTGATSETHRLVLRILTKSGVSYATGTVDYVEKRDRVRSCDAWILRGAKVAKAAPTRDWLDIYTGDSDAVISESRRRLIKLESQAEPGDVFAFETRVDSQLLFAQVGYRFGSMLPIVLERYQVKVPAGFRIEELVLGPARLSVAASPDGQTRTWELANRPYKREEPWAANGNVEEPGLLLSLVPPAGHTRFRPAVFRSWADATSWELRLDEAQCVPDANLIATAKRLTAGCPDTLSRIQALATFTQQIRYVMINRDLGKGYGYRPRPATEVLVAGYGDCKDKANLLCTLLRQIGVVAHPVGVLSADGRQVEPGWPSLGQFNHAIVAIEVDDSIDLPPIVRTAKWGRLLIFDPTDEDIAFGDLPWELQGTKGELVAAGVDELIDLPRLPEEQEWSIDQRIQLSLEPDGSVRGSLTVRNGGQAGANLRSIYHRLSEKELRDTVTRRLTGALGGLSVTKAVREDLRPQSAYGLSAEFGASSFPQPLQGGSLLMVRLDILNRDSVPVFSEKTRRTPIRLRPVNVRDEVTLNLPKDYSAAELPPKTTLQTPYGIHETSFEARPGAVIFHRTFILKNRLVPVEEYAALRKFLADAAKADRAAVLLRTMPAG